MASFNYNFNAPFRYLSSGSSRTACRCRPEKTFLLVAVFAVSLMVIGGGGRRGATRKRTGPNKCIRPRTVPPDR